MNDYQALQNISKKLQRYMSEHQVSILKLSQRIPDIKYQTLKRIVEFNEKESLPNVSSLMSLAKFLNCNLSELLSGFVTLEIKCYASIDKFYSEKSFKPILLHIPIDDCFIRKPDSIFAVESNSFNIKNGATNISRIQTIHIFARMQDVEYDGYYIAEIQEKIRFLNVLSVSSTQLTIKENEEVTMISKSSVTIIAKYIKSAILTNNDKNLLFAFYN
ncbi:MAG: helix-turn-helix domain-containing protein [Neisseriaceae bacterium]